MSMVICWTHRFYFFMIKYSITSDAVIQFFSEVRGRQPRRPFDRVVIIYSASIAHWPNELNSLFHFIVIQTNIMINFDASLIHIVFENCVEMFLRRTFVKIFYVQCLDRIILVWKMFTCSRYHATRRVNWSSNH